jgi:chromosome segregation ATPase
MIESIMYIGIGFLIAGLLVIGVIPLVHARAVRLTMRRLEADNPLSMAEIAAEKDQLRAEFAMTMSRLEMTVEQLKAKTTNQLTEIAKNSEAIGRIKFELSEKTAALLALEAKENQLSDDLAATQSELADKTAALEQAERALASTQSELTQVTASFNDSSVAAGGQRVELVALRAQTEALKGQVESYEKETKALWDHLNGKTAELEASKQQLAEQRARADEFANRDGELDRQLDEQPAESATLAARVQELQRELAAAKRDAENAGAYERMENAVLRERIDEVAAEVARLTATLEGPDSPIETILNAARPAATAGNGPSSSVAPLAGESKGTLAERIRALQARAARAAEAPRGAKRAVAQRGARADK